MLASITGSEEMLLSEDESKQLAKSSIAVMRHYNVRAQAKTVDWCYFLMTLGGVYGSRLVAINQRHKNERARKNLGTPLDGAA